MYNHEVRAAVEAVEAGDGGGGGGRYCRPPSLLNRIVMLPKSVWAPRAACGACSACGGVCSIVGLSGRGGERTKRIWSPEGEVRAWRWGRRFGVEKRRCVER